MNIEIHKDFMHRLYRLKISRPLCNIFGVGSGSCTVFIQALGTCLMLKISSLTQWSPPSLAAQNLDLTTSLDG